MEHTNESNLENREYRSDVFSMLLNIPENASSVYNALNGTSYTDCSLLDLFGSKLIKIPTPKFVVFYNGKSEQPDQVTMKLSDAFIKTTENPELELICRMININYGHSQEFLTGCQILKEYSLFVDIVHQKEQEAISQPESYLDNQGIKSVISRAIDECIRRHILETFLRDNRNEVLRMMTLDYSFQRRMELNIADAKAEGKAEGRVEGISLFSAAILGLKNGKSREELLSEGISEEIIEAAFSVLKECKVP